MSILINKAGILTTVQDAGRNGYRRFGINPNGAMDKTAARLINILLGNPDSEDVLEIHFPGSEITFQENAVFALGGANFRAKLSGESLENWKPYYAEKGSVLKFTEKVFGSRLYLSVQGGFALEKWLGSASTNLTAKIGGLAGGKLQKGDEVKFKIQNSKLKIQNTRISDSLIPFYSNFPTVRVTAGAEFESLTAFGEQCFRHQNFTVSQNSDRMGFRLNGTPFFLLDKKELVSSAVNFGTIQLLPDGQLIVLMADAQTSGGYPRIAHIVETDLPIVAQLSVNDRIAFQLISIEEAEDVLMGFNVNLNFLRVACKFRQV
jgi:antagonist of KipI